MVKSWWMNASFLLALLLSACGGMPTVRAPARVRFLLEPTEARVYTDSRFVGSARLLRQRPARFRPGVQHFTIRAEGYFPHDVEMDLPSGLSTVRLRLRPIPR